MPETSSIQSVTRGSIAYVRVYGVIDESFDPDKLVAAAEGKDVILNLKAVSRLSSFGVREWVHAVTKLAAKVQRIYYVECSPAIVAQLNMIANFAGSGSVVSVQVPMICESCNWDTETLIDIAKHNVKESPQLACKRCGSAMTIDDLPELYFAFASNKQSAIDPSVEAFLKEFQDANPGAPPKPPSPAAPTGSTAAPPPPPLAPSTAQGASVQPAPTSMPPTTPTPMEGGDTNEATEAELAFAKKKPPYAIIVGGIIVAIAAVGWWLTQSEPQPQTTAPTAATQPASAPASQAASAPVETKPPPVDAAAEQKRAMTAYAAKDYETTVTAATLAVANGVSDADMQLALADAHQKLGHADVAIAGYAAAEALLKAKDKRLSEALFQHAEALVAQGKGADAKPLYDRLLKEFPKTPHKKAAKAALKKIAKKKR